MLHTKFCGNRPAGSGEEDFSRVFTIYGRGGHLGHVTSIMPSNFHFLVSESFHTKFGSNRTVVSEKIWFEFLYVHDLGSSVPKLPSILTYLHKFNKMSAPTNLKVTGCNSI